MTRLLEWVQAYPRALTLETKNDLAVLILSEVSPPLRAFIHRQLRDPAADEVCQDTWLGIVNGLERFRGKTEAKFWSWCWGIARHKVRSHLRRQARDRLEFLDLDSLPAAIAAADTRRGISLAERLELDEALALLRAVAPPCVEYLWRFYVLGWTDQELARAYGTSEAALRMRRQRCLRLALKLVTKKDSTHG